MDVHQLFWNVVHYLFPKDCFEELLVKMNFFHPECSQLVLSRFLGLGIIAGSVLVKVPQILKIFNAKSGAGVALSGQLLELTAVTCSMGYSYTSQFPFSAWGEALFLTIQTAAIVALILIYSDRAVHCVGFTVVFVILTLLLCSGVLPPAVMAAGQASNIPIVISARLIQAMANYRNQSTGQLSAVTVFMMFAGSLARIFTSAQETGDKLMIYTYVTTSIMNGVIFSQILMYWGRHPPKKTI